MVMQLEYSPAVELALKKAIVMAQRSGSAQVRPVDLLGGLMDEEEGQPALQTHAAGVPMDKLRGLFPPCENSGALSLELHLAAETTLILAHAGELARLHGAEGSISSDYLLLALLEGDLPSRSLLEDAGLDFTLLKNRITPPTLPLRLAP